MGTTTHRRSQLLAAIVAVMSLFVSAVSACACSHHQPVKAEAGSCHSSSHLSPAAERPDSSAHFGTDCNCFVRTPAPVIVAKKDDKRTAVAEQIAEIVELRFTIVFAGESWGTSKVSFEPPLFGYKHSLLASLPARAPPRL